jgi:1,5-anhydro-D-fructose reductase (1,5-anhydro-D-mannitol-forming)
MVRFGIVGFGLHAVKRLMPGFRLARNACVTALSRRDAGRARRSAKEHGIPQAFVSAEELCRSPEVDAVFVATPDSCHLGDTLVALECGKPVLLEKPMAMNAAEASQMVERARAKDLLLGIAHIFRFADSTRRLRQRVAAGEIGHVVFARSEFSYVVAPGHPRTWIHDAAIACGGPIADVGVHCIDALRFILDDEVARVSASARASPFGSMEAAALVSLEFRRSGLGAVLVSSLAEYRTPIEIIGDRGILRADNALRVDGPITIELRRPDGVETEQVSNDLAYARQVDAFADAVEGRANFPVPGEEGWKNQVILDAAYRSMKSGRTEAIASDGLATG